jgi:hypothetical protein
MYKMMGADGREYGPVSFEQLRQWIAEGRANAQTSVQVEGITEWKTLSALPEFAEFLRPGAPTSAPPPLRSATPDQLAAEILARDYTIRIGDCIRRGWELVKADFWMFVGATALTMIISSACTLILGGPMLGGLYMLLLKRLRKQSAKLGDLFIGFNVALLPLILAHIVSTVLTNIGFLLCILPGFYLLVSWVFTMPLIVDKRLDFWPAMELSRKVVAKHWWALLGLMLVSGLVAAAGLLLCCIGFFATLPVAFAALACAYDDVFGSPQAPWLADSTRRA